MSWYFTTEYDEVAESKVNAGGKARQDICAILSNMGMSELRVRVPLGRGSWDVMGKMRGHREAYNRWMSATAGLRQGDVLVIQFPTSAHTLLFPRVMNHLAALGVRVVLLIHDLDSLRPGVPTEESFFGNIRVNREEDYAVAHADVVIAHNPKMANLITQKYCRKPGTVVSLGIFDYLIPHFRKDSESSNDGAVVIAGNLSPRKAGYLSALPQGVHFNLYGLGFEGNDSDGVSYYGAFLPEVLPCVMTGGYGLVWDGDSPSTCSGAGAYLTINDPHKTSLYLAGGLPVITWKDAAIADFIQTEGCGIVVAGLEDIQDSLAAVSKEQYDQMSANVAHVGARLRDGFYTRQAMTNVAARLGTDLPSDKNV